MTSTAEGSAPADQQRKDSVRCDAEAGCARTAAAAEAGAEDAEEVNGEEVALVRGLILGQRPSS